MTEILSCRWCNSSGHPNGEATCHVEIQKLDYCHQCQNTHQREYRLYFCTAECMCEYFREERDKFLENVDNFKKIDTFPMDFVDKNDVVSYESVEKI